MRVWPLALMGVCTAEDSRNPLSKALIVTTNLHLRHQVTTGGDGAGTARTVHTVCSALESFIHDPAVHRPGGGTSASPAGHPPAVPSLDSPDTDNTEADNMLVARTLQVLTPVSCKVEVAWREDPVCHVQRTQADVVIADPIDVRLSFDEYRLVGAIVDGWSRLQLGAAAAGSDMPTAHRVDPSTGDNSASSAVPAKAAATPPVPPRRRRTLSKAPTARARPSQQPQVAATPSLVVVEPPPHAEYHVVYPPNNPCALQLAAIGDTVVVTYAMESEEIIGGVCVRGWSGVVLGTCSAHPQLADAVVLSTCSRKPGTCCWL